MKEQIILSRTELLNKLTAVSKALSSKSLIPAHDSFLFEAKSGILKVTAADREGNITTSIEAERIESDFSFLIEHKILLDGLKVLPEQPIELEVEINDRSVRITLKHEAGTYSIPGATIDDFSRLKNEGEGLRSIAFKRDVLINGIKKVYAFAGRDELRPIMSSVYMECKANLLTFAATNSNMMGIYEVSDIALEDFNLVLPLKFAKNISELAHEDDITLEFGSRNITASFGETVMIYRLVEGNYPNYRSVIPRNNDKEVIADVKSFVGALKRTSIFSNKSSLLVSLEITDQSLTVKGKDVDFNMSAQESLAIDYSSPEPIEIGFKSDFLLQCLNAVDSESAKITMRESNTAALISPVAEPDYTALTILLMPMMINV